ncbi:MAG: (Fe-S)-binding protein [Algoriphagus sp.]
MKPRPPHVGLFIPCYMDQFYPQVALASLELLEKLGCKVSYPIGQTCCGQPLANAGYERDTLTLAKHFVTLFKEVDYIVAPTGSCVLHVKSHFPELKGMEAELEKTQAKIYELTEFLTDILQLTSIKGKFPHKVGFHASCHGLRGLRLSSSSELQEPTFHKAKLLLDQLEGLEWVPLSRPDECCGFGGTFAVSEEALSICMGKDRILDHERNGTEILTGVDMSCLMHLQGIGSRSGSKLRYLHLAEILNQALA